MNNLNEMYDYLVEMGIATKEEIDLVTSINGWNIESFNSIIYCRTGYRDINQLLEEEGE